MFLTLEARLPCLLCGYRIRCLLMNHFRINKRSLRKSGKGPAIVWSERWCPECRTPNHSDPPAGAYVLTPTDRPKVAAYRAQRWPQTAPTATHTAARAHEGVAPA